MSVLMVSVQLAVDIVKNVGYCSLMSTPSLSSAGVMVWSSKELHTVAGQRNALRWIIEGLG